MKSNLTAVGTLKYSIFENGILLEEYVGQNLIVLSGRDAVARLLGGVTGKHISKIGFGTDSTEAELANTGLTNQFVKNIESVSYPAAGGVEFTFSLGVADYNGNVIREFGLFTNEDVLFARKVRAAIEKNNTITIDGTWSINF